MLRAPADPEGLYQVAKAVIWREDVMESLAAIDVPSLVVASDGDRAVPADRGRAIARAIDGCELLELGSAGHMTAVERPDEVTAALRRLLERAGVAS